LPRGFLDSNQILHREVTLRLATGKDDYQASISPRVVKNPHYKGIEVLSYVVLRIGEIEEVTPAVIRQLFALDYYALIEEFNRLNYGQPPSLSLSGTETWDTESETIALKGRYRDGDNVEQPMTARMRAARAEDEVLPWGDERVRQSPAFRPYIVLSRVLTQLTGSKAINPALVQELPLADLERLWKEYHRLNFGEQAVLGNRSLGGSLATPESGSAGK
jgi:hypothetical protein